MYCEKVGTQKWQWSSGAKRKQECYTCNSLLRPIVGILKWICQMDCPIHQNRCFAQPGEGATHNHVRCGGLFIRRKSVQSKRECYTDAYTYPLAGCTVIPDGSSRFPLTMTLLRSCRPGFPRVMEIVFVAESVQYTAPENQSTAIPVTLLTGLPS